MHPETKSKMLMGKKPSGRKNELLEIENIVAINKLRGIGTIKVQEISQKVEY